MGWAGRGHDVACVDADAGKVSRIARGLPPFFEEGLGERLRGVLNSGRFRCASDYSAVGGSDVIMVAVGTPPLPDGSADLSQVRSACASIAGELRRSEAFSVVAVRSTVLPGATEKVAGPILAKSGVRFGLAMIPEFLREGSALSDFGSPDRIVIGCSDERTRAVMEELHRAFDAPKIFTDIRNAEMIKYASNAMLASRVAAVNEIANICGRTGADADTVMRAVGMDRRLGPHYLVPGPGFGGSCLPKDLSALERHAREMGEDAPVLHAVSESNRRQKLRLFQALSRLMPVKGRRIAVLGLAFKSGTDDIRESPAIPLIEKLLEEGAAVRAYDPEAIGHAQERFPAVEYAGDWAECLSGCDAALLVTAWPEFMKSAAEYKEALKDAPLIDARRVLSHDDAAKAGLNYHALGRGAP